MQYYNDTLTIKVGLAVTSIVELDPIGRQLTANVFMRFSWNDKSLVWDKEAYGGLDSLRVPAEQIWRPEITLYNGETVDFPVSAMMIVYSTGDCLWVPPVTYKAWCETGDMKRFPFDRHECFFKFGSWVYDGFMIDVQTDKDADGEALLKYLDASGKGGEWAVSGGRVERHEKYYSCCEEPYPDVSFYLTLTRRAPYYTVSLVIPSILTMLLTLATFWFPPDEGEKLTMGCFNLLYLLILLCHLQAVVPPNHLQVPSIVLFCGNTLLFSGLSVILSVATLSLSRRGDYTLVPTCFEKLRRSRLASALCLPDPPAAEEDNLLTSQRGEEAEGGGGGGGGEGDSQQQPHQHEARSDWVTVATALDRIFFYAFCLVFVVVLACSFA